MRIPHRESEPERRFLHPYRDGRMHYADVIMTTMASQITSLTVVYSTFYSDADQRKHQSSESLAFVWGIHRDRWIPRTKDQLRGKCFHLMTSSWNPRASVCVGNLATIDSDNGLSPGRRQAIIWTNAGILLIAPLRTNYRQILIEIHAFSFKKIHLKMSSAKWRQCCQWAIL